MLALVECYGWVKGMAYRSLYELTNQFVHLLSYIKSLKHQGTHNCCKNLRWESIKFIKNDANLQNLI